MPFCEAGELSGTGGEESLARRAAKSMRKIGTLRRKRAERTGLCAMSGEWLACDERGALLITRGSRGRDEFSYRHVKYTKYQTIVLRHRTIWRLSTMIT